MIEKIRNFFREKMATIRLNRKINALKGKQFGIVYYKNCGSILIKNIHSNMPKYSKLIPNEIVEVFLEKYPEIQFSTVLKDFLNYLDVDFSIEYDTLSADNYEKVSREDYDIRNNPQYIKNVLAETNLLVVRYKDDNNVIVEKLVKSYELYISYMTKFVKGGRHSIPNKKQLDEWYLEAMETYKLYDINHYDINNITS